MLKQLPSRHRDTLILFFYPILLAAINSNWIFSPTTNYLPDTWFYLGYFRYFDKYAPAFPSFFYSYFGERLTWNVPGFYIYKLFPPLLANYVLHLSVYYVAVYSLYGTLKLLFNQRTALISALLMGSYPWFLRAVGWDYPDGTGIAHMLLLIYLLTLAHYSERHRIWLILAGAVFSSSLITNLFWVSYSPSWAVYFLVLNLYTKKFKLEQFILIAAYFLMGCLLPVAVAALYYYRVTGDFVFFKNSIMAAISLSNNATNVKSVKFIYGEMHPDWNVLPFLLVLISTWKMVASKGDRNNSRFVSLYVLFILAYGWLVFWNFYSVPLLIIFSYSSFILPAVFLLFGAIISGILDALSLDRFGTLLLGTIILLFLPLLLVRLIPDIEIIQGNSWLIGILGLLLVIVFVSPKVRIPMQTIVFILTVFFYLVGEKAFVYEPDAHKGKDHYLTIISASDAIDQRFPNRQYDDVRLWFHADKNYDTFFSLGGLYLYPWGSVIGYRNSREEPPATFNIRIHDEFHEGDNIVILSSNPNSGELVNEANRVLAAHNAKIVLESSKTIQQGKVLFFMYFTSVTLLHA